MGDTFCISFIILTSNYYYLCLLKLYSKEKTDNLKSSYENLTQAMKDNSNEEIKSASASLMAQKKKINDLVAQQAKAKKTLDDAANKYDKSPTNGNEANLIKAQAKYDSITKSLKEEKKAMDDAGVSADTLANSQNEISNINMLKSVQDETKAKEDKNNKTLQEIQEYQQLSEVENKNSTQKERMTQLSEDLANSIQGLTISKNKYGNVTITNAGLLNKNAEMLKTENKEMQTNAKTAMEAAKKKMTWQENDTTYTYEQIEARVKMYQEEERKLKQEYENTTNEDDKRDIARHHQAVGFAEARDNDTIAILDNIYNSTTKVTDATKGNADENNNDYTPSEENATSATKENTAAQKQATQAVKEATNAMKDYDNQIKEVENSVKDYDYELTTLNDHSEKYIQTLEKKRELLQQELALTQQASAAGKDYANNLSSMSGGYSGNVTSGGTKWTGKYSDWINDAATKNGFDPTLIASIIEIESGFNPNAYNRSSGATGLGQFLASTAREVGLSNRANPEASIYALASYLRTRVNQAGSLKGGIKGYGEGTEAYYNRVMSTYSKLKNGDNTDDSTASVGSTYESGAESILSQAENLQGNIDSLKEQIDQITEQEIKAKEGEFDDQITEWQKKISIAKTESEMYNDGAEEKVKLLKTEWQNINDEYGVMEQKRQYLYNAITKGGYNEHILEFLNKDMAELMDTEKQTIQNLHSIFDEWIKAEYQSRIQIYQDEYDKLNKQIDLLDTKDKNNYKDKLDLTEKELIQQQNILAGEEDEFNVVTELLNKEKNDTTKQVWNSEIRTINDSIAETKKTIATLRVNIDELDLENKLKNYVDDIKNINDELDILNGKTDSSRTNGETIEDFDKKLNYYNQIDNDLQKQNEAYKDQISLWKDLRNEFEQGSEVWTEYNDKINDALQKQSELKKDRIDNAKKSEELAENQVLNIAQQSIYGGKTQQEFEDDAKAKENAIDAQLKLMDKQEQNLEEQETRNKNLLDLEEARKKLQEDQENRTVQQLTKNKNGEWQFTYVANQELVDQDEKDLRDKQISDNDWERQNKQSHDRDTLNDEKEKLEEEVSMRQETMERIKTNIENVFNDQRELFKNGQTDIATIVENSLNQISNLYNKTFPDITNVITENVEKQIAEMNKLNPTFSDAQNSITGITNPEKPTVTQHIVYGSDADLENAKAMLGTNGYTYKDISIMTDEQRKAIKLSDNDLIVGGAGVTYGVTENQNDGTGTRLWGQDRNETNQKIAKWSEKQGAKHFIYAAGQDMLNAKATYGDAYTYISTDGWTERDWENLHTKSGDIVIGTQANTQGLALNGATRLAGADRSATAEQVENNALDREISTKRNVYASGQDLENAKKTLDSTYYNLIDIASKEFDPTKVQMKSSDWILGGEAVTTQINTLVNQSQARRIYGQTASDTNKALQQARNEDLENVKKYNQNMEKNVQQSTQKQKVLIQDAQTKESYSIEVGANTNLDTVIASMNNICDVTNLGMNRVVVTVNNHVQEAIESFNKLLEAAAEAGVQVDSYNPTHISNVDTRPIEYATGSDAAILQVQYGDTIRILSGTGFSGRAGSSRYDTNRLYQEDLARKGYFPIHDAGDLYKYKDGGLVNYTGLAQVDGSPSKPESFLNPGDTKNIAEASKFAKAMSDIGIDKIPEISVDLKNNIMSLLPTFKNNMPEVNSQSNNQPTVVHVTNSFDKIELPGVIDGESFIRELNNSPVRQFMSSFRFGY
ncbi:transglycosylase SLT domain-containing protein [Clostridium fermenticellae]|nr:transglycosylase SLT domain-containing protein [Clostridium fermenticellae]